MENNLIILLYHGVTNSISHGIENYSKKHVSEDVFRKQMEFISQNCNVLSMDEVVGIVQNGKSYPDNAVAVTFDDGFRNNFTVAAPILDNYNIPATFYITSGIINTDLMFWVDVLEDCINLCTKPYIDICLTSEDTFDIRNNENKINALSQIKAYCKSVNEDEKNRVIQEVAAATGVTPSTSHAANYEKMSWNELQEMNKNDLFIIGGHSLYHNILSKIPTDNKLKLEVQTSIALLEYNLNQKITHYSYPEGQHEHYNEKVITCLKDMGVVCSPSAIDGINDSTVDLFNLKRIMVGFMGRKFPFNI